MNGLRKNAIRLFRVQGIEVSLHWWWFLVAAYEIGGRQRAYSSIAWNALEYLALFLIVLMHEFGHALACRQVGGIANQIVLWPLGGVAYVNPPQRPGAMLWSIAAGPLVNVALVPVLLILGRSMRAAGMAAAMPDLFLLVRSIAYINLGLLIFNMLPVYPLDGGQILRALLWFVLGRARSLIAATIIGFLGVAGLGLLAIRGQSVWLGIMAAYILVYCLQGWKQAQALLRLSKLPRHGGYYCPSCQTSPPLGAFWRCSNCQKAFDTFQSQAHCPHCSTQFATTACLDCGRSYPLSEWTISPVAPRAV
jgi:Zn-dependent protease